MVGNWAWSLVFVLGLAGCADAESGAAASSMNDDAWLLSDASNRATTDYGKGDVQSGSADMGAAPGDAQEPSADSHELSGWQSAGGLGLTVPGPQNTAKFRALVALGKVPPPGDFSMPGWLNEHHAQLPAADPAHPVDLHPVASLQVSPQGQAEVLLQLGVNTAKSLQDLQPPVAMVLLVDKSGSLGASGWQAIQQQLPELAKRLPAGSWLAVVAFSTGAEIVRPMAAWQDSAAKALTQQLKDLPMGDGTDLYAGIEVALKELAGAPKEIAQRRVLLISDGAITKGDHTPTDVVALAKASQASFSTVGYGLQAQVALLGKLALVTSGTHYSAANPDQLIEVLAKHSATLLVAVAENLLIRVELTAGWQLIDAFGLPVAINGQKLQLGELDDNPPTDADNSAGAADVSGSDATQGGGAPTPLAGALYPADHSGLVVLRLRPPQGQSYQPGLEIQAAQVMWSYALSKDHQPLSHAALVQLKGLLAIPDGGYEVFSHPEARRVNALVQAGEALLQACTAASAGKRAEALLNIESRLALVEATSALLNLAVDDPSGDLQDTAELLGQLRDNLAAQLRRSP